MDLLNYHLALPKARCVMGHYILSRETVLRYKNEWDFVTILRDPVDRWYSHYFYNKGTNSIFSIDTELDKFVETTRALSMGSQYVSVVTGRRDIEALRSNPCIEEAIDTLSNFSLVGLLENLDDFCDTFKEKFGVRLNVPYINITPREKRRGWEHIPEKIHQKVVVLCQPDIEVYRIISGRR